MAESRYNRLDNQSPVQTHIQNEDLNFPSSAFDFSTIHSGNAQIGAVIPVDCFDVTPHESVSISMSNLIEFRNPTSRNILNGFRVYFHAIYNRLTDLWEGAKNFLDTGYSGSVNLTRPNLIYKVDNTVAGDNTYIKCNANTPCSLLNYLGLPSTSLQKNDSDDSGFTNWSPLKSFRCALSVTDNTDVTGQYDAIGYDDDYFPADCAMAYQRNWRDFYANRNLLQSNQYWFPDNENHFILSYHCEDAVCIDYENEDLTNTYDEGVDKRTAQACNLTGIQPANIDSLLTPSNLNKFFDTTPEPNNPSSIVHDEVTSPYLPNLSGLKFRQFRGDRFNTALPFPDLIRGSVPVIELNKNSVSKVTADGKDVKFYNVDSDNISGALPNVFYRPPTPSVVSNKGVLSTNENVNGTSDLEVQIPVSEITLNTLRALETFTVFKERNARISSRDSFYNGFIEAQFGHSPNTHDSRGVYLGGFYQDFALSSVTQTSQSTEDSPLGQKAGQGISNGQGTICSNFLCPDFGWIQIYMSIVPDVFYTQGKPRMFSKKLQLDMYFPLFNNLEPQAILNKELFVSDNASDNADVFAYEDRYAEYKSRPNRVSGFMALSHSVAEYDASRIMARRFESTPALNHEFVTMVPENIDMQVFSVYDEPPFDFQCGISVRRVALMPYTAVPGSMSSQIHA